jgi:outer membrane lipoprotein SlyB
MKSTQKIAALLIVSSAVLGGCVSTPQQASPIYSSTESNAASYGTIDSIQVTRANPTNSGGGAVVGGLVGGLLGNQVGSGRGRTAATVAGAVGGAVVGNQVERRNQAQGQDQYQVNVRLDNGQYISVVQDSTYDLRAGHRVRVVDGRVYRY